MPDYFYQDLTKDKVSKTCLVNRKDFSIYSINLDEKVDIKEIENENTDVKIGGQWSPKDCHPLQNVAVILPYRNRQHQFYYLIKRLHPMLRKQKLNYTIFLINQIGERDFNRGLILNLGVIEALKLSDFDCIVFHDVDLIPEKDENIYFCDNGVRQISSAIDDVRYHVKFWNNVGGVMSISKVNYFRINGHPNVYWGWGSEDNDFSIRSISSNLTLSRPYENIGRYKMVKHLRAFRPIQTFWLSLSFRERWLNDGLNSVIKINKDLDLDKFVQFNKSLIVQNNQFIPFKSPYQLLEVSKYKLYTNISVRVKNLNNLLRKDLIYSWESLSWILTFYGWL